MQEENFEIRVLNSDFLKKHYEEFYALFSENTRGHEQFKEISESYINEKANNIFTFLDNGSVTLLGCIYKDEIVGILWAYKRTFMEEKRLYINSLIINRIYRGKGIGKRLMEEIEKFAVQNDIFTIDVSTSTFKTDAIKFYENLQYTPERLQLKKKLK